MPRSIERRSLRSAPGRASLILLTISGLAWLGTGNIMRAQSVTAILVGTVSDQSGASVPNATVSAIRVGTNLKRTVSSNEKGDFIVPNLDPGSYQLVGEHAGFKRTVMEGLELLVNQTARVDLVLQVGAVAES